MRIIIEIPESEIPKQQDVIEIPFHFIDGTVCEVGGYGFDVLPKGHGRLIDADALGEKLNRYTEAPYQYALAVFNESPTIIEADKAESEVQTNV